MMAVTMPIAKPATKPVTEPSAVVDRPRVIGIAIGFALPRRMAPAGSGRREA